MRGFSVLLLLALFVWGGALSVQVKVGNRSFPLEAVKQLKEVMDSGGNAAAVCAHPRLPPVFGPTCHQKARGVVFSRLVQILMSTDPCEICANPSCFGCLE